MISVCLLLDCGYNLKTLFMPKWLKVRQNDIGVRQNGIMIGAKLPGIIFAFLEVSAAMRPRLANQR